MRVKEKNTKSMKERPILFSGPMVRAILEGRKTQTRRIVRICDEPITKAESDACRWQKGIPSNAVNVRMCGTYLKCDSPPDSATVSARVPCPYGHREDRLWVREPWRIFDASKECSCYDDCVCSRLHGKPVFRADCDSEDKWKPSIYMPRKLSRLTLEIVRVRVERLQDITKQDAIAEGVRQVTKDGKLMKYCVYDLGPDMSSTPWSVMRSTAVGAYAELWESINGVGSWALNPWVWVVEFKRVIATENTEGA